MDDKILIFSATYNEAENIKYFLDLIGDLNLAADVLIIDDMIDTAGTLVNAAEAALKHGAKSVSAVATHPVLSVPALERIQESEIKHI